MKCKTRKKCPVCGRIPKQQFKDLYHCKCGISLMKRGRSWEALQRAGDMVFKLDKHHRTFIEMREG